MREYLKSCIRDFMDYYSPEYDKESGKYFTDESISTHIVNKSNFQTMKEVLESLQLTYPPEQIARFTDKVMKTPFMWILMNYITKGAGTGAKDYSGELIVERIYGEVEIRVVKLDPAPIFNEGEILMISIKNKNRIEKKICYDFKETVKFLCMSGDKEPFKINIDSPIREVLQEIGIKQSSATIELRYSEEKYKEMTRLGMYLPREIKYYIFNKGENFIMFTLEDNYILSKGDLRKGIESFRSEEEFISYFKSYPVAMKMLNDLE